MTPPPLGLYVHLPWCVAKCPYCDFNSHALRSELPEVAYLDAVIADLQHELARTPGRPIETVFFGGGTPSLISPDQLYRVLELLRRTKRLAEDAEITLEANPGTAEAARFAGYRDIGINRLSIGVQTFDDDCLQRIGRIHNADEARNALHIARDSGFTRLNIDLMYGLPGQQPHQALADAREAVSFDPGHISQYQLTLEPGTVFAKSPPSLPDDDITWAMLTSCQAVLSAGGYRRYEVSALARDGQQCRHNLNYWLFGDYIGVGAGAHGKLTLGQRICRTERPRPPTIYMSRSPRDWTDRVVDEGSLPFEFMLNALRLPDGFDPALFVARTGLPATTIAGIIEQACAREMLSIDTDCWRASEQGLRFLNDLQAMFLPATSA